MTMLRFRVHEHVDNVNPSLKHYGIQCRPSPTKRWVHCTNGDDVVVYPTKARAKEVCEELQLKAFKEAQLNLDL